MNVAKREGRGEEEKKKREGDTSNTNSLKGDAVNVADCSPIGGESPLVVEHCISTK